MLSEGLGVVETDVEVTDQADTPGGSGIAEDLISEHSLADLSRKSLDDFPILDCRCQKKGCFAGDN